MGLGRLPHESYFALAIVLLKLKPGGTDIEDFILAIRQSLKSASDDQTYLHPARLDTAILWKHLFLHKKRQKDRQQNFILDLQAQLYDAQMNTQKQEKGRKRKIQGAVSVPNENSESKRLKLGIPPAIEVSETDCDEKYSRDHTQMLRVVYRLAQVLRSDDNAGNDKKNLIHLIRHASAVTIKSINISTKPDTNPTSQDVAVSNLREYCDGVQSVWSLLIQCLGKVGLTDPDAAFTDSITPAAVSAIQSLLDKLHQCCLDEADYRLSSSRKSSKKANSKNGMRKDLKRTQNFDSVCNSLTKLLTHILASTKLVRETHPPIFDGIACIFLDHLGESMSYNLFGTAYKTSDDFVSIGYNDVDSDNERAALVTQLEAPHLVRILHGLMGSQRLDIADFTCTPAMRHFPPSSFAASTLEKLQNTMLRGIFGREDNTFADAFQRIRPMPSENGPKIENLIQPGECDKDWFLCEIWESLGWDVLTTRSIDYNSHSEQSQVQEVG